MSPDLLRARLAALVLDLRREIDPTVFGLETSYLIYVEARAECADRIDAASPEGQDDNGEG